MTQFQKAIFSVVSVIFAGFWGYAGDSFATQMQGWMDKTEVEESPTETVVEPASQEAIYQNNAAPTNAPKKANPFNNAATSKPQYQKPPKSNTFSPPTNPYAAMNRGNLKNTLETMTPNGTRQRSNAYFDKLSEQLRDLQGENPPEPVLQEDTTDNEENIVREEVLPPQPVGNQIEPAYDENPELLPLIEDIPEDVLVDELEQLLIEEGY